MYLIFFLDFVMKIHFLILFAQFDQIIAAPGKGIVKTICSWYNVYRFDLNPIDGMQHIMMDNLYTDYFLDNSATDQRIIMLKIAICTHVYMMRWTIEQNKDKLCKMRKFRPLPDGHDDAGSGTSNKAEQNAYKWLNHELTLIRTKVAVKKHETQYEMPQSNFNSTHFGSLVTMCFLLKFKFQLFHTLRATTNFGIFPNENVSCKSAKSIRQSVEMNLESIREWMLSDLVYFFKQRPKLVQYFDELQKRNNESEMIENRQKFVALFGIARTALFCDIHFENFEFFAASTHEKNIFYALLYKEFLKQNNKVGKWRAKIMLDKYLYSEWFKTFYSEMKATLKGQSDGKLHKMAILADLQHFWDCLGNDFWLNEKNIREAIGQFVKKNGGKMSKLKEPFLVQCQPLDWAKCQQNEKDLPTLWENGPEDVSLFRAMTICTKEIIIADKVNNKQAKIVENDDNFLFVTKFKFLQCVEKSLKNNTRRDDIVAKLHFEKIEELLEYEHCDDDDGFIDFTTLLPENKQSLKELLDSDGFKKVDELLKKNFEYFSPVDNLSSESSDVNDFLDANDENFDVETNNNENNTIKNKENFSENNTIKNEENFSENNTIKNEENFSENNTIKNEENFSENNTIKNEENFSENNSETFENDKKETNTVMWTDTKVPKDVKGKKPKFGTKGRSNSGKSFELRRLNSLKGQLIDSPRGKIGDSPKGQIVDSPKGQLVNSPRGQIGDSLRGQMTSERQLDDSPSPKGQFGDIISFDPLSSKRQLDDISSPTYYTCKAMLKQIGIEKFSDLLKDYLLGNFYKNYLENKFDDKCVVYLHISMFVRTIEAKLKTKTTNFEKNTKWISFKDKTFVEEPQFLANKLFVVQNNLDELAAFGKSRSTGCLDKAMEMLNNVKMRRVGKDIADQFENILPLINHQNDDDVIRITQFGSYKMETFKNVLIQLHNHIFASLCAEKLAEIPSKNEQNAKLLNLEKLNFIFNEQEMLLKKVEAMNIVLKQQQIGKPIICESNQYNLIRTNPANRQNDVHLSNGIVQFITPFCAGEEKNSMIDQIKRQIASVLKKWVQKVANFEQPFLLTSGSHLMSSDLDSSDLDLICVVPEQIHLFTFYGEKDTTLYSMLRKELSGAKLSWIAGKVPLIRIEFGPIEVDLLLVPLPIKYLTGTAAAAAQLEGDQVIKDISSETGIYSLAGYRSSKFQLSLVNDKQLFAYFLKSIKVWAKNRLIYSGIFGYFNGATLTVMVTKICALFPFAPLAYLLYKFFQIYSKWNWHVDPVLLDKLSKDSLNFLVDGWPPKFGESSMTVITPNFPEQNAAFNVNKFTLRTIVEEMNTANQILSENVQKWARIFEEVKYAKEFAHFAIILCADVDAQRYATNCGFYRCKIRRNLFEWATGTNVSPMLAHYQIISQSEEKTICNISDFAASCTFWVVGLTMKNGCGKKLNELPPIYRNDSNSKQFLNSTQMSSSYTNAQSLSNKLNELRASTAAAS